MTAGDDLALSRRLALGAGTVLGVGALLGAAGCTDSGSTNPATTDGASTFPPPRSAGPAIATPKGDPSATAAIPTSVTRPSIADVRGPDITAGPRGRHEVALTFHGQGASEFTDAVLAACRAASATITVFAVGTWVHADPTLALALYREGHEVGNHTWSHQSMRRLSASGARTEVRKGREALTAALGDPGWWFRPSGTPRSTPTIRSAAVAAGYARCVSYDVDPQDYLDPGAKTVRQRVRRDARGGSIVSLHLGHPGTAEALPGILSDLAAVGLRPVALSRLLRD